MNRYLLIFLFLCVGVAKAQTFSITRVEVAGDKVNLFYDLQDQDASRTFTVSVYSSRDNYISTLGEVTGDVGLEVRQGGNRKIVWDARKELGSDFNGKVALEIRGKVYIPFVRVDNLYKSMKRGKVYEITWTGGTQQNILNFDLYKGDTKVTTFANIANVGHYSLTIPTTVKPSSRYQFKITDSRNKEQIVYTSSFAVKRKVPLLLKVIPVLAVGGVIFAVSQGNKPPANIADPVVPGF